MTLNYDCFRQVLLALEQSLVFEHSEVDDNPFALSFPDLSIEQLYDHKELKAFQPEEVFYALYNLEQAGYVTASIQYADDAIFACDITDITYEGHMLLKNIKSDTVWQKVKGAISKVGGSVSVAIIQGLALH